MATASYLIAQIRKTLNDTVNTSEFPYRWSDAELLRWISDAQREVVKYKPEANPVTAIFTPVADEPMQQLDFDGCYKLIRVEANLAADGAGYGKTVRLVQRDVLDSFIPNWGSHVPANADTGSTVAGTVPTLYAGSGQNGGVGDNGPLATAEFASAIGIDFAADGTLFIAMYSNAAVRRVAPNDGTITTLVGNGTGMISTSLYWPTDPWPARDVCAFYVWDVCAAPNGDVYFTEDMDSNGRMRRWNASTDTVETLVTLYNLDTVTINATGTKVYFACSTGSYGHRVYEYDVVAGTYTTICGNGVNSSTGDGGQASAATINNPSDVLYHNGYLYIAEYSGYRVRRINLTTGVISTVAGDGTLTLNNGDGDGGQATAARVTPNRLAIGPDGNLYIQQWNYPKVRKVDLTTGIITTVAGNGGMTYPANSGPGTATTVSIGDCYGVAVAPNGDIYLTSVLDNLVAIRGDGSVQVLGIPDQNGGLRTKNDGVPKASAALGWPNCVRKHPNGDVYVGGSALIWRITPAGTVVHVAGTGYSTISGEGIDAKLCGLRAVAEIDFDAAGNVYWCEGYLSHVVRKLDINTGIVTTVAGTPGIGGNTGDGGLATAATLNWPSDIAIHGDSLYICCSSSSHCVRRVNLNTGIITTYAGTPGTSGSTGDGGLATAARLNLPVSIDTDQAGNLYIADTGNDRIRVVDAATGIISTVFSSATDARLDDPRKIRLANDGSYFVVCSTFTTGVANRLYQISGGAITKTLLTGPSSYYLDLANNMLGRSLGLYVDPATQHVMVASTLYHRIFEFVITTVPGPGYYTLWAAEPDDPRRFYLYPKPAANQAVWVTYAAMPPEVASSAATLTLSDVYLDALRDYAVFRAYLKRARTYSLEAAMAALERFGKQLNLSRSIMQAIAAGAERPSAQGPVTA